MHCGKDKGLSYIGHVLVLWSIVALKYGLSKYLKRLQELWLDLTILTGRPNAGLTNRKGSAMTQIRCGVASAWAYVGQRAINLALDGKTCPFYSNIPIENLVENRLVPCSRPGKTGR